ncbi:aurora kinase-like [Cyclopterus lumpus]|uniref:aurora kinase-like n=1 Tax=Cyclopterus lumpus TaxID=8103 RepID=UPI00148671F4|nr:aurora kinase-like [Cyclopterus lumpus]
MGNIFGFTQRLVKRKSSIYRQVNKRTRLSESEDPTDPEEVVNVRGKKKKEGRRLDSASSTAGSSEADFEAKFKQQEMLGIGGFGTVFAGYRKADTLPVAIKRILKINGFSKNVDDDGKQLPSEVAVMLRLADKTRASVGTSAPVSLLDWYDLDQELILVLERPIHAEDLCSYIKCNGGSLQEEEAKIILKQLVDAAIELQDKCVFHRDIKMENILIETSSDVPQVRLIDFGLSCFVKRGASYCAFSGTLDHAPPEWYIQHEYKAGPTTVFQIGVVLFETLHGCNFTTKSFIRNGQRISKTLSEDCQDFLRRCFNEDPEQRPTLEQLKQHPWLILGLIDYYHDFEEAALEIKTMENYNNDSLAAGLIRPSSSPAGAGFFFVSKKDNDKPWFTAELRKLRLQKDQALRSGDKDLYTESKYRFSKAVRDAKRLYSEKLQQQLSANDSASLWRGLRQITNYKPKSPHSMNNVLLADDLNEFYCRFERQWSSPEAIPHSSINKPQTISPPSPNPSGAHTSVAPSTSPVTTFAILERDVNRLFKKQNPPGLRLPLHPEALS